MLFTTMNLNLKSNFEDLFFKTTNHPEIQEENMHQNVLSFCEIKKKKHFTHWKCYQFHMNSYQSHTRVKWKSTERKQ